MTDKTSHIQKDWKPQHSLGQDWIDLKMYLYCIYIICIVAPLNNFLQFPELSMSLHNINIFPREMKRFHLVGCVGFLALTKAVTNCCYTENLHHSPDTHCKPSLANCLTFEKIHTKEMQSRFSLIITIIIYFTITVTIVVIVFVVD